MMIRIWGLVKPPLIIVSYDLSKNRSFLDRRENTIFCLSNSDTGPEGKRNISYKISGVGFVSFFNGISNFVGYLMSMPFLQKNYSI